MLGQPMLYFFNLTDGDEVIHDEQGLHVRDFYAAVTSAMEAIAELRQEALPYPHQWQAWTLEITDPTGCIVISIPLEAKFEAPRCHA